MFVMQYDTYKKFVLFALFEVALLFTLFLSAVSSTIPPMKCSFSVQYVVIG